jgi:GT2 family glycosyltransferase
MQNRKIIRNNVALGHSAACAAGASVATRPYLCLLNSDTVITPWCWYPIKAVFEQDSLIGVAGPSTSRSGNEQTIAAAGHCRLYWSDSQINAFAGRLIRRTSDESVRDLPWISGFAFFVRRFLWQELGGFDRKLPDYGNEQEMCKRIHKMGYRTVWIESSYTHHLGGQSYEAAIGTVEVETRRLAGTQYLRRKHGERA